MAESPRPCRPSNRRLSVARQKQPPVSSCCEGLLKLLFSSDRQEPTTCPVDVNCIIGRYVIAAIPKVGRTPHLITLLILSFRLVCANSRKSASEPGDRSSMITSAVGPGCVKTRTTGRSLLNFCRFSAVFPPLQARRSEKVRFRCDVFRQFPSFHTAWVFGGRERRPMPPYRTTGKDRAARS